MFLLWGILMKEEKFMYYMFHKPGGCITARRDENHPTVMDFFPEELAKELFPVGRLDKDTEGLLLLTNDGNFDQLLMHPEHHAEKVYFFYAMGEMTEEKKKRIEEGQLLLGEEKPTKGARLTVLEQGRYFEYEDRIRPRKRLRDNDYNRNRPVFAGELVIYEGRKHQVKRMLLAEGCRVVYLKRTAIAGVKLDEGLEPGQYRRLTGEELEVLFGGRESIHGFSGKKCEIG